MCPRIAIDQPKNGTYESDFLWMILRSTGSAASTTRMSSMLEWFAV